MAVTLQPLAEAAAARIASAAAASLKQGQVLEAVVLGKTADGLTQLKVGDQVLQSLLKQTLPAGTTLQLAVKSGGATPQLTVVSQTPPPVAAAQPPAVTRPPVLAPPSPSAENPPPTTPHIPPVLIGRASATVAAPTVSATPAPVVVPGRGEVASAPQAAPATTQSEPPQAAASAPRPSAVALGQDAPRQVPRPGGETPVAVRATVTAAVPSLPTDARSAPVPAAVAAPARVVPDAQIATPTARGETPPQQAAQSVAAASVTPAPSPVASSPVVPAGPGTVAAGVPQPVAPGLAQPAGQGAVAPPSAAPGETVTIAPAPLPSPLPLRPAAAAPEVAVSPPTTASPANAAPQAAAPPLAQEAVNPLLLAQSAPRAPQSIAELPRPAAVPITPAPAMVPPPPSTPQAALAQALPQALANQASIGPLLRLVSAVLAQPSGFPETILRAARQVLGQQVVVDGKLTGEGLQRAIAGSGLLLEANLAKGAPVTGDGKAALLALKSAVSSWLAEPSAPPVQADRSPPLRGSAPRAPAGDLPAIPEMPRDLARAVHSHADAALSRTKLLQLASLPDADAARAAPEVRVELPLLMGNQLYMAQFQIAQDGGRQQAERKRGWTMRFALSSAGTGEVGAEVGLLGSDVNVALWAADPDMAARLNEALPELESALTALGLRPGAIRCRGSVPETAARVSGRLVDSVS